MEDDRGSMTVVLYVMVIVMALFLALFLAIVLPAGASAEPLAGNKGGCGRGNMRYGVACTVTDAGPGFVSGTCVYGYWFSRVATARTFRLDQSVTVNGCLGEGGELYAPIRVSR
jgi:hypothetical protein